MTGPRYRLGVDVGGTHTDLVLLDAASGALMVEKVASTPKNPALGVLDGVARFVARGIKPADIEFFAHGTTITTNALLEMRGAKVGLLITQGFRAVQEIQAQARDGNLFDYFYEKPAPIAPQSLTKEIPERSDYQGNVLVALDRAAVRCAARALKAAGVSSIAVCYLFSFANPAHEAQTRQIIREEHPEAHVSLSSEVLPRLREWPRLSTTLINAYLEPVMVRYIDHLNQGLDAAGVRTQQRFLMQSNGGVMRFSAAIAGGRTVHTLLSGPAAGAQASGYLAERDAGRGLVTLDMGGTSADIAFIDGGVPLEVTEGTIARRQIDVPALDMTTISAGGGSIASVDGGFLNVGPHSAGADPGPACYGRGGTRPTVTDADIVCGLLNPDYFLGGAQRLDVAAAQAALAAHVADPLRMSVRAAAAGIRRIVDMRMADEIRVFAAKRGVDLTAFTLLPFGGAGAVHAAAVADELGMARILVPPRPGAFSALGLLCTDVVHDYIRSELKPLDAVAPAHAEAIFRALEAKARDDIAAEGLNGAQARFARELDLRYTGQGYELRTPLDGLFTDALTADALGRARERFDARHAQLHGHAAKERPVEVVSYRLRLRVAVPKYAPRDEALPATLRAAEPKGKRTIHLDDAGACEASLYERDALDIGAVIDGPAIVEQFDATTVIPPGWRARVDRRRNLVLDKDA
ncbi:MAG TPA: hydantoinase/oxoprolinase family protein [Xanthobacteraceae bacterium]|nr:hydantoinase/oxoprolinase family protein [Xanthobacteraceae bacterium]